jgi:alpha-D-ribose 1-methylphosphonate 5-triphosphate synthase subunit PhnL
MGSSVLLMIAAEGSRGSFVIGIIRLRTTREAVADRTWRVRTFDA